MYLIQHLFVFFKPEEYWHLLVKRWTCCSTGFIKPVSVWIRLFLFLKRKRLFHMTANHDWLQQSKKQEFKNKTQPPSVQRFLVAVHSRFTTQSGWSILWSIILCVLPVWTLCVYKWLQFYRCKQLLSTIDPAGLGWTLCSSVLVHQTAAWHNVNLVECQQKNQNTLCDPAVLLVDRMHWFCKTCLRWLVAKLSAPHRFTMSLFSI